MLNCNNVDYITQQRSTSVKLSTRARYGTRALLDLAMHASQKPVQLKDIANRQNISLHYLEHLVAPLATAGIVRSTRGVRGGIQLVRDPKNIKLGEVVQLLEGTLFPVECISNPTCPRINSCAARDLWTDVKQAIDNVLDSVTLKELVEKQKQKETRDEAMYYV